MEDYARLGLDMPPWRVSPINWEFSICETYPRCVLVPRATTTAHLVSHISCLRSWCRQLVVPMKVSEEDIHQVKQFRSKGRIPVPTWRHKESGSIIVRCSQPKTGAPLLGPRFETVALPISLPGLLSDRSEQDEKLISSIRQACGSECTVYLIDARPRMNAVMNTFAGVSASLSLTPFVSPFLISPAAQVLEWRMRRCTIFIKTTGCSLEFPTSMSFAKARIDSPK